MPLQPARMRLWMLTLLKRVPVLATLAVVVLMNVAAATAQESGSPAPLPKNEVVAVVNADPITRNMLADATIERYGADVLDNMINRYLILQECQQRGIQVTQQEVSEEISRLAGKFGLSMESYLKLLEDERDITPNQYSREIIWPMLALRRLVADRVEVTQEEFNQAYLSQFGEAVKCRLIMVADRSKADELQKQAVAAPGTFSQLAKKFSEDETSASVGGLIPPIRRYTGDSRLEDAAFALQNGGVSEVMQLGDQWIVLQAVRRIPATTPSPQALPAIKEQIRDRIRDEKMRGAASDLFAGLQEKAQVVKVLGDPAQAKKHPGAAAIVNGQQVTISQVGEECIKRYGIEVLEGEINRKLLQQALRKEKKKVTQADLDAEVSRAAVSYGYVRPDGQPDLGAWIESVTNDGATTHELYVTDVVWPSVALKKLVEGSVEVTEEDLQQGFDAAYGPRVEVLAVVLSDQRSAQKIWEMARDNPTEAFFGKLAEQYSIEPVSASNRGKVPPIRKHGGQPAVEKEAFGLKPGELSGIIATGGQYLILRCQGFTEPVVSDAAAVRDELIRDVTETKINRAMADRFEKLLDTSEIDNFLEAERKPRVANGPKG